MEKPQEKPDPVGKLSSSAETEQLTYGHPFCKYNFHWTAQHKMVL